MKSIPKFEIGIAEGRVCDCNRYGYKFICRVSIPTFPNRMIGELTVEWLRKNNAKVLYDEDLDCFFSIIFITNNESLVNIISCKYKASMIEAISLYKTIDFKESIKPLNKSHIYSNSKPCNREISASYYDDIEDEYYDSDMEYHFNELEDYSSAMAESSDSGWFYSDPDYSAYEDFQSSEWE